MSATPSKVRREKQFLGMAAGLAVGLAALPVHVAALTSSGQADHHGVKEATSTVADFRRADPSLSRFFDGAAGYAVFPAIAKGAFGIGAAHGRGVLFEHGQPVGRTTLTQVTIGAQLGGQSYSEVVFFESADPLKRFKEGEFAMAAQTSAVAASEGASADARYARGVAVFTLARSGLMAEASVGGQKFAYTPFAPGAAAAAQGG